MSDVPDVRSVEANSVRRINTDKLITPVLVIIVAGILGFVGTSSVIALINQSKLQTIEGNIEGTLAGLSSQLTGIQSELAELRDPRVHQIELKINTMRAEIDMLKEDL